MRLVSIELRSYRRFRNAKLNVDGDLIAIVGPNEAGKSSLLRAFSQVNDQEPIGRADIARGSTVTDADVMISLHFLLGDEDRSALHDIRGSDAIKWLRVDKAKNGRVFHSPEPPLSRERTHRLQALYSVGQVREWYSRMRDTDEVTSQDDESDRLLGSLEEILAAESEMLPGEALAALREQADRVRELLKNPLVVSMRSAIEAVLKNESQPHPNSVARSRLSARVPQFLFFNDNDRFLATEYGIDELTTARGALSNLLSLADSSPKTMADLIARDDPAEIAQVMERINARLHESFRSWSQSSISLQLRVDRSPQGGLLTILVRDENGEYSTIADRSEGLRAFVALVALTTVKMGNVPPILLIDEAETHLHYEAQADLIRVLSTQQNAAQVLYTTHSAGALPDDLGTGVRVLAPNVDGTTTVNNSFWALGSGLSPLLVAMGLGASALAFTAARRALVVEGAADLILLPTLFREALGRDRLDFQIAPGLAEVSRAALRDLDLEAGRVGFLVDGDEAGRKLGARLHKAGFESTQIAHLGDEGTVEDLLDNEVYASAVFEELARAGHTAPFAAAELPSKRRASWVAERCEAQGISTPNKAAVAQRAVEQRRERSLLSAEGKESLQRVFEYLSAALAVHAR